MNQDREQEPREEKHAAPTQRPGHPLAGAGEPITQEEAARNSDRELPA